ncbi:MAG: peptidylprolyl isomerase [Oscillospiraceae bacterium]|nr:peptidylprolyl isomerase [Oscillospiraceae bacterium]
MKRFFIPTLSFLLILALFAGCTRNPEAAEESADSQSLSEQDGGTKSYTLSEAAAINARIKDSDIDLIQFNEPESAQEIVIIKTSMGDIEVVLYPNEAPMAVENFINHARAGYYTGLTLDNVLKNFIVEGGDPDNKGGESAFTDDDSHPYFKNEYSLSLWNFRGALGMANKTGQDKNGSRFYIVQASFVDEETLETMKEAGYPQELIDKYEEVGGVPGFDWKRTVFGMVTEEGMKVVDAIARLPVDESGKPEESVVIDSISVAGSDGSADSDDADEEDGDVESEESE